MKSKKFSLKEIANIIRRRQENELDSNIVVSGTKGLGKSTFLFKLLKQFDNFDPWKQQVYSRDEVIKLLEGQHKGIIFDDEAIASGYKREFHNVSQQKLIKMLNMYRDHFNIFCMAIPNFYSLDKDIRDAMKFHIHIIERGKAVLHIANEGRLYQPDKWDVNYNQKVEQKWQEKMKNNPRYSPAYWKLTTFRGFIEFGDLPPRQKELYKKIKATKRRELYEKEYDEKEERNPKMEFIQRIIKGAKEGFMNLDEAKSAAYAAGYEWKYIRVSIDEQVKKENPKMTLKKYIDKNNPNYSTAVGVTSKNKKQLNSNNSKKPIPK